MAAVVGADPDFPTIENTHVLGSLPQYDSQDLAELVKKITRDNNGLSEDDVRRAIYGQQSHPDTVNLQQLAAVATSSSTEPWLEIAEQPRSKGIRFRYKCEGRSAGSIPGESSTNEHKTFPSVKINNFKDQAAIVVVSCVTKDEPYRPHPHTLVGKECRKGVCTIKLKRSNVATFPNLGIQCVTKKEIKESLQEREQIRVDPFGTGYYSDMQKLQLNIVRLCFQAFLPDEDGKYTRIVQPVVSQAIYDKKAVNDLVVCRLSKQSGSAKGGDEVFMFCEKVNKDDIQVRFYEEIDDDVVWESYAEFGQSDVHRQFAIVFKTPPYRDQYINRPVEVYMQLFRPSDEGSSESKKFQYIPNDPDPENIARKRKRKINFQGYLGDSNPNTPAFNLLTDNMKDERDLRGGANALREKLRAKASRSSPMLSEASSSSNTTITDMSSGVTYTSPVVHMVDNELIIHTSHMPVHHIEEVTHSTHVTSATAALAEMHVQDTDGNIIQEITYIKSDMGDNEDVMLHDLPIGKQEMDDGRIDSGSLPSIGNLPSMDVDPELLNQIARDSRLQTDSAKESPRMTTRGKRIAKK